MEALSVGAELESAIKKTTVDVDCARISLKAKGALRVRIKACLTRSLAAAKEREAAILEKAKAYGVLVAEEVSAAKATYVVRVVPSEFVTAKHVGGVRNAFDSTDVGKRTPSLFIGVDEANKRVVVCNAVPKSMIKSVKAGDWLKEVLPIVGGKGGGKPTGGQGQGTDTTKVDELILVAEKFIKCKLE
eukprot:TRINITY_DN3192_c0_g1_i2.p2 TRINITY_DN3192_c0_g1~~TRINITY_DN3192_c0_g1_i2.p2  ORF type:complete len:188 (-),score=70.82 TRINITY_DN3192_c0_g1_i2:45-608(-)